MAKVTITIEDLPDSKVKITSEPNFETMMGMELSGSTLTSAHGYAFKVLNECRKIGKSKGIIREIPLIKKAH